MRKNGRLTEGMVRVAYLGFYLGPLKLLCLDGDSVGEEEYGGFGSSKDIVYINGNVSEKSRVSKITIITCEIYPCTVPLTGQATSDHHIRTAKCNKDELLLF